MKIAVWYNLPSGGAKRALCDQLSGLAARGHHIEVWYPANLTQNLMPLPGLVKEHLVPLSWQPQGTDFPSQLQRLFASRWLTRRMFWAVDQHCRRCAAQIEASGFDLLFSANCVYTKVPPLARYLRIPSVLYLQEPSRELFEAPSFLWPALPSLTQAFSDPIPYLSKLKRERTYFQGNRLQVQIEIENARQFELLLVNSYFSRESVLRAYGLDATVCYLGIDTDYFVDQSRERQRFVIGVGLVAAPKNIHFVLEALGKLPPPRPPLVWVGNGEDRRYAAGLRQRAKQLDVDLDLKIGISDQELLALLNTASVAVCAPRLEPFGYAPLEANACGLPVVAVAEGGLRETIISGVNGIVVDPEPEALATGLSQLLNDPAQARQLGASARRHIVEHWSLQAAINRLEARLAAISTRRKA
jgi:glycosyltransferase involved in cell wall biosynthesis